MTEAGQHHAAPAFGALGEIEKEDLTYGFILKPVDVEAASRLLSGAAFNAALWVASSDDPNAALPKAVEAFQLMASGLLAKKA